MGEISSKRIEKLTNQDKSHFDRRGRLVMAFALGLVALSLTQLIYRFTLPTKLKP